MGQRIYQIDVIKIFAVFSVVAIHFLLNSGFYDIETGSIATSIGIVCRLIFITAVPLFMMVTGFLMGDKTLNPQYITRLLQVVVIYMVVSLADWAGQCLLLHSGGTFTDALWGLLDFSTDDYAWYVDMYIGLYLIIPILNAAWHYNNQQSYHVYIISVAILLFFCPSIFNAGRKIMSDWWIAAYPIGYYYLGLYFKTYRHALQQTKWRTWLLSFFVAFGWFATMSLIDNYHRVFSWTAENDYMGYQPMILAVLIFILLLKLPMAQQSPRQWPQRLLIWLGNITLTIYLFSHLTDRVIYDNLKRMMPDVESRLPWAPIIVFGSLISAILLASIVEWGLIKPFFKRKKAYV